MKCLPANFKKDAPLLFLLMVLTLILRLPWRAIVPIDIDEAFQIFVVSRPTLGALFRAIYSLGPQQYPLDYVIGFFASRLTLDIATLRLLPIVWGAASVATVYFLGRLFVGRAFGWLWALLLSSSMLHIQYSVMFRPYALIVLLSLLSILFFWKSLESRAWLWPYAAASILYSLIYPFAICKTIMDLVCVHIFKNTNRRPISWIVFSCWVVFALMALVHIRGFVGGQHFRWDLSESWGRDVLARIVLQVGQYNHRTTIIYMCLFTAGIIMGFRSTVHRRAIFYFTGLIFCTAVTLLLVIPLSGLFLRARHMLPLLPLFLGGVAIPAVAGLHGLGSRFRVSVLLLSSFAFSMTLLSPLRNFKREIVGSMNIVSGQVEFIRHALKPGDKIVFGNPNSGATFVYYDDRAAFPRLAGIVLFQGFDLFEFPPDLVLGGTHFSNQAYTLCRMNPALATTSPTIIRDWAQAGLLNGTYVYLVDLPMNYFSVADPFREVAEQGEQLTPVFSGIYRVDIRTPELR